MSHPRKPSSLLALSFALTCAAAGAAHASGFMRLNIGAPVLSAGASHVLLVKADGQVWSWGGNVYGQIGDATNNDARNPVKTQLAGVLQVAAGTDFSLAVDGAGMLWSWGRDDKGQLGNGATSTDKTKYRTPVKVDSNGDWRAVAAGADHGLGIKMDGKLYGWGANDSGQLCKTASSTREKAPIRLGADDTWLAVAAGKGFSIALRADGLLFGCGTNANGEMNTGTAGGKKEAVTQLGSTRWTTIAAGSSHVVAIKEDGTLWAWGLNDKLQAAGAAASANVPAQAQISSNQWRAVSAGDKHSVGVKADGTTWGWGDNTNKELAKSDILGPRTPFAMTTTGDGQILAAGAKYTVAIRATGVLQSWGLGSMLGIGTAVPNQSTPVSPDVVNGTGVFPTFCKPGVVSAGSELSLAVRNNGRLQSWGRNSDGQLAKGHENDIFANYSVANLTVGGSTWIDVAAGESHGAGIKADGSLWTWGGNHNGQLGIGSQGATAQLTPVQINSGTRFLRVFAHYAQTFAIAADGKLYSAGDNIEGQLGIGTFGTNEVSLKQVPGLWAGVAVDAHFTFGIDTQGRLYYWGDGYGSKSNVASPTRIGTSTTWVGASTGVSFGMGIKANGQLFGWGSPEYFGDPAITTEQDTPKQLFTTRRFTHLAVASSSVLVQASKGEVWGWGTNRRGQLGVDFPLNTETSPKLTFYFNTRELSGGGAHFIQTCASGGFRMVTGSSSGGQTGLGIKDDDASTDVPISISPRGF